VGYANWLVKAALKIRLWFNISAYKISMHVL
jgi:hypothetical protein